MDCESAWAGYDKTARHITQIRRGALSLQGSERMLLLMKGGIIDNGAIREPSACGGAKRCD